MGEVDHQEDLQVDHPGVTEGTLGMDVPGDGSLHGENQFQLPDLKLWAHCALRPQHGMLGEPSPGFARGYEK